MKKIVSFCLVVVILITTMCAVYAQNARYENIVHFAISGSIESTFVDVDVSVDLYEPLTSKVVVSLERSLAGSNNFSYFQTIGSKTFTKRSYLYYASKNNLTDFYDYRLKIELFVYDDSGNEIEYDYMYLT